MYVRDVAVALMTRGHEPIAYSREIGDVADELRSASVHVIDDLAMLTAAPDVIHGQHHLETMAAVLRFPGTPAVHVCHGWTPWEENPVRHPRIRRHVAVSELLAQRLTSSGIPPERVEVLGNAVDLQRFRARAALPAKPVRALVFGNHATETLYLPLVRSVCTELGMALDVVGAAAGTSTAMPEELLGGYDIVFAKGRSALEALAVGCAVIVCDETAVGGMVTAENLSRMRAYNFGLRVLQNPLTPQALIEEIQHYDPADALQVSETIRATAGLDQMVDRLESIYGEAIADHESYPVDPHEEGKAEAAYLQWLKDVIADKERLAHQGLRLQEESHRLNAVIGSMTAERDVLSGQVEEFGGQVDELSRRVKELNEREGDLAEQVGTLTRQVEGLEMQVSDSVRASDAFRRRADSLSTELDAVRNTVTWRVRGRLLASPRIVQASPRLVLRVGRRLRGSG